MVNMLKNFHLTKDAIIEAEARCGAKGVKDDFNIPKLELMQSFAHNIIANGALHQYSADVSERLHITQCKNPFERTTRRHDTFVEEVATLLNRQDNIRRFDLYHVLCRQKEPLETIIVLEDTLVTETDPTLSFLSRAAPGEKHSTKGPRPFRNHFVNPKGFLSPDGVVAFHVTVTPDRAGVPVAEMQPVVEYLQEYINANTTPATPADWTSVKWDPSVTKMNIWYKFRIQQRSSFCSRNIMKSQVVMADPRTDKGPYGCHDMVLLSDGLNRTHVARVMSVFSAKSRPNLPPCLASPLLFVEYFPLVARPEDDQAGVGMYKVQHPPVGPASDRFSPNHGIVSLSSVLYALELIPVYATKLQDVQLSTNSCLDAYEQYYVNCFADKESYHVLS